MNARSAVRAAIVAAILVFVPVVFLGQSYYPPLGSQPCAFEDLNATTANFVRGAGKWMPSQGQINVLFVFAQYPDDNYDASNPIWPAGAPVRYALNNNYRDEFVTYINAGQNPTPVPGSVTEYFTNVSGNRLRLYGDVHHVIAPHTRQQYVNAGKNIGDIHQEILQLIDVTRDFGAGDLWQTNSEYHHILQSDGVVDFVFIIWRNTLADLDPAGQLATQMKALTGGSQAFQGLCADPPTNGNLYQLVDGGTRMVVMDPYYVPATINGKLFHMNGGGATHMNFLPMTPDGYRVSGIPFGGSMQGIRHEIGHHLLGAAHPQGLWTMIAGSNTRSSLPNAFEMDQLGWIDPITINHNDPGITSIPLGDFATTRQCIKIQLGPTTTQPSSWYYLENHQMISKWDFVSSVDAWSLSSLGLYVIRAKDGASDRAGNDLVLVPSEGMYDWLNRGKLPNPYDPSKQLRVLEKSATNRVSGYLPTEQITFVGALITDRPEYLWFQQDGSAPVFKARILGEGLSDHFDGVCNSVFSPWSSPSSRRGMIVSNKTMNFNNVGGGLFTVDVFVNGATTGAPSLPRDFICESAVLVDYLAASHDYDVHLTWQANIEPDLASYEVRRSSDAGLTWTTIASVAAGTNSFVDSGTLPSTSGTPVVVNFRYRIRSKDNDGLYPYEQVHGDDQSKRLGSMKHGRSVW